MANVTGIVKAKSANKFGFGMMVNDKWYNSKFEITCQKGDEVEFDDGGKNYIKGLKVLSKTTSDTPAAVGMGAAPKQSGGYYSRGVFPIPPNDGQRSIIRQNSITNAVALFGHLNGDPTVPVHDDPVEWVLIVAREFEKYSSGDLDTEVAKEIDGQFEIK